MAATVVVNRGYVADLKQLAKGLDFHATMALERGLTNLASDLADASDRVERWARELDRHLEASP